MKRIGIYFFGVIAVGCLTSSILYWENEKSNEIGFEKMTEEMDEEEKVEPATYTLENLMNKVETIPPDAKFEIKEEDGYLVIYDHMSRKVYDETTIRLEDLPEQLQMQVNEGMFFASEEALYEFLENYSS